MIDIIEVMASTFAPLMGYLLAVTVFIFFLMLGYCIFICVTALIAQKGLAQEQSRQFDAVLKYGEGSTEELTREEPLPKTSEILKNVWKAEDGKTNPRDKKL